MALKLVQLYMHSEWPLSDSYINCKRLNFCWHLILVNFKFYGYFPSFDFHKFDSDLFQTFLSTDILARFYIRKLALWRINAKKNPRQKKGILQLCTTLSNWMKTNTGCQNMQTVQVFYLIRMYWIIWINIHYLKHVSEMTQESTKTHFCNFLFCSIQVM